jgi:hypothetical protein
MNSSFLQMNSFDFKILVELNAIFFVHLQNRKTAANALQTPQPRQLIISRPSLESSCLSYPVTVKLNSRHQLAHLLQ